MRRRRYTKIYGTSQPAGICRASDVRDWADQNVQRLEPTREVGNRAFGMLQSDEPHRRLSANRALQVLPEWRETLAVMCQNRSAKSCSLGLLIFFRRQDVCSLHWLHSGLILNRSYPKEGMRYDVFCPREGHARGTIVLSLHQFCPHALLDFIGGT